MTEPENPPPEASPRPEAERESLAVPPPLIEAAPPAEEPRPALPPPARRRILFPILCLIGFLALAAGLGWTWNQQQMLRRQVAEQSAPPAPAIDPARLESLQNELSGLRRQVEQLAQRPAPAPTDLGPLESRVGALESRPQPAAPDIGGAVAPLAQQVESLAAAQKQQQSSTSALADRVAALEKQAAEFQQAQSSAVARAAHVARLQAAWAALDGGQPLGPIPDAPPALARFADSKPPTEAELRLSFPEAARRAEAASQPSTQGESLGQRIWQRAQLLVTVRRGDKVVVGTATPKALAIARERLDAGDLAGTVAALDQLDPAAAQAMADWRNEAQALIDARAALTQMARG